MGHRDILFPEVEEFFKDKPVAGKKLLEVGPGDNVFFRNFFEGKDIIWLGVDPCLTYDGYNLFDNKMENLEGFCDGEFDFVFGCHSFEHCERPVDALKEFHRVLKPGGRLFLATPNPVKHHILDADEDHIMCLNEMQFTRLLIYCGFKDGYVHLQRPDNVIEQDFNMIVTARKEP